MKRNLLTLTIILTSFLFTGCSKFIHEEDRIEGSWQLYRIERNNFFIWKVVDNSYASGIFTFYSNGSATYTDSEGQLNGTWKMRKERNRYRDNDGDWVYEDEISLEINLFNFNENRIIDLDFDKIRFRNRNNLLAEYSTPNYRYRYDFRRQ